MTHVLPDPPTQCYTASEHLSFEDALLYTAHLLHSASATALDCREGLQPHDRARIQAVWHLVEMAKTLVDRSLECMAPH
ncbi:DUF6124 family protein [Pseudomonas sp. SDO528_S397]